MRYERDEGDGIPGGQPGDTLIVFVKGTSGEYTEEYQWDEAEQDWKIVLSTVPWQMRV